MSILNRESPARLATDSFSHFHALQESFAETETARKKSTSDCLNFRRDG